MNADRTWLETADAGWAPVDMPAEVMEDSFVSGDRSGRRLTLRYYTHDDGSMMAKVLLGPGAQGPPGHAHGGSMASLLDETMGGAAWMSGYMVVAAELNVTFKKMLPLGTVMLCYWLMSKKKMAPTTVMLVLVGIALVGVLIGFFDPQLAY